MNLQSTKTFFAGSLLLIVIITTIIVVSIKQTQYVKQLSANIEAANEVIKRTEYLLSLSLDNETGARGYMITGDPAFLSPFEKAKKNILPALDSLRKVATPENKATIDSIAAYTMKRMAFSVNMVALRTKHPLLQAIQRYNAKEGKSYTDQIRLYTATIQKEQSLHISQLRADYIASFNRLNIIQYSIIGITIILLILLANQFRIELKLIKKENENFESLIDAYPDANIIVNDVGNIIMLNKQAEKLFGYSKSDLLKQPIEVLLPDMNKLQHQQHRKNYQKNPHSRMMGEGLELFALTRSKQVLPVEISLAPVKTSHGIFISAAIRDITERKEINRQLQVLNNQLSEKVSIQTAHIHDILTSISDVFIALDRNFCFTYVNQPAANRYHQKIEYLLGKNIWEVLPAIKESPLFSVFNECMNEQCEKSFEEYNSITQQWFLHNIYPASEGITVYTKDITERKLQEEEMQKANEELRRLSGYLQQVREEERKSIARDIHDDLGQQLTGLQMDAHWLRKKITGVDQTFIEKVEEFSQSIDTAIISVRKILSNLRPNILDDLGMIAAIEWLNMETMKRYPAIQLIFNSAALPVEMNPETATSLFRIYQEALSNAIKHANADTITASLRTENGSYVLQIEDNGKGIDHQEIKSGRYGILGIRERTYILGGSFSISTEPGKGTSLTIIIPIT